MGEDQVPTGMVFVKGGCFEMGDTLFLKIKHLAKKVAYSLNSQVS